MVNIFVDHFILIVSKIISIIVLILLTKTGIGQGNEHNNISFDVRVKRISESPELIMVLSTLYNPNYDTVCFRTYSCDGMQYEMEFDKKGFSAAPTIVCNFSYPVLVKIPPKEKIEYSFQLKLLKKTNEIRIGYNFIEVNCDTVDTSLEKINLSKKKHIIWAPLYTFE